MLSKLSQASSIQLTYSGYIMGMETDGSENLAIALSQFNRLLA
jgi:hypothetical protein